MLEYKYASIDEVPEEIRAHYKETEAGGEAVLQVKGMVPRTKLDEFRATNKTLNQDIRKARKELTDLAAAFEIEVGDELPEDLSDQLTAKLDEIKKGKGKDDGKKPSEREAELEERLRQAAETHRQALVAKDQEVQTMKQEAERTRVAHAIRAAAAEKGVRPKAVDFLLRTGRDEISIVDGEIMAVDGKGNPRYGEDGVTPLDPEGWIESHRKSHDFLFEPSQGSGTPGGRSGSGGTGSRADLFRTNPFTKKYRNLDLRSKLAREDPALAAKLKEAAAQSRE